MDAWANGFFSSRICNLPTAKIISFIKDNISEAAGGIIRSKQEKKNNSEYIIYPKDERQW